jgi:putative membrane protein
MTPQDPGDPPVLPEPEPARDEAEHSRSGTSETHFSDASRRTFLAQERTLLAWWRTALGTMGVAVAIGAILPKLTDLPKGPLVALGAGYAALSLCFVLLGGYRHLAGEKALARRSYLGLSRGTVIALSVYMAALLAATAWVMFWGPD